jgi:multiple sugar transport system ATP-binding protein
MTLADRLIVMNAGNADQIGPPLDLYERPATMFVAGFIGSPAMNFLDVRLTGENGGLWAETDGMRIKVPGQMKDRVSPHAGKAVTLGVRPEDLHIAGDRDDSDLSFPATVEVVERLGSEILLDVAVGSATMVASVEPTATAKVHETLRLAVNPARVHFFDHETEAAI